MKSFYQFWNQINGPMYRRTPPPVRYDLADYQSQITSSPVNNTEGGSTYELRPITWEDTASYAAQDVADWYAKYGVNSTKLGKEMSDEKFKKFCGQTW